MSVGCGHLGEGQTNHCGHDTWLLCLGADKLDAMGTRSQSGLEVRKFIVQKHRD